MPGPSVNLLSWLRPEQIHVAFAGRGWELEATTAAHWIGAIAYDFDGLSGVFPGLIRDQDLDEMHALLAVGYDAELMTQVARDVVQAAAGRDWWWTVNLTRKAIGNWIFLNGLLVRQGVRVDSIGLPDWLDACYSWLFEHSDENQRAALNIELNVPPRGVRSGRGTLQMLEAFQAD